MLRLVNTRWFFTAGRLLAIPKKNKMPPRPKWLIVEDEIEEKFLKGGKGPGGQKINKSNSKVQLTHKPTGIVVQCQYSRSQEQNRKRAREILALKIEERLHPDTCRNAVIKDRMSKVKEYKLKKTSKKYREIDEKRKVLKQEQLEKLDLVLDIDDEFDQFLAKVQTKLD